MNFRGPGAQYTSACPGDTFILVNSRDAARLEFLRAVKSPRRKKEAAGQEVSGKLTAKKLTRREGPAHSPRALALHHAI